MEDIKSWQEKIKEKRKNTDFRDFLNEIASWCPIILYKNQGKVSRYNEKVNRIKCIDNKTYFENYEKINELNQAEYNFSKNFFDNFNKIYSNYQFPLTYEIA